MDIRRKPFLPALIAAAMMMGSLAVAGAEEPVLEAATEQLFISAGCPQDTPGTCTSTRWLGLQKGDATSNFVTSVTPVDEVLYRADGTLNWRDYASDDTLRLEGYPLRADAPLKQTVAISAKGAGVNTTVHGRIDAVTEAGDMVTFGPQEMMFNVLPNATQTANFEFDIPAELEGVALDSLIAYVAVHGVNAQAGYIDQQGGSSVTIPYWRPAAVVEPAP